MSDFDTNAPEAPAEESPQSGPEPGEGLAQTLEQALGKVYDEAGEEAPEEDVFTPSRDERGRFARKDGDVEPAEDQEQAPEEASEDEPDEKPEDAESEEKEEAKADPKDEWAEAPEGFHDAAREAWKAAPKEVRAEVHRRVGEMQQGLQEHQERWAPLEPWDKLTKQYGTSIPDALQRYVGFEQSVRQDPVNGLRAACHDMGLDFDKIAHAVTGTEVDQGLHQAQQTIGALQNRLRVMEAEYAKLRGGVEQQNNSQIQSEIAQFKAEPGRERFDELEPRMAALITQGFASTLPEAYDLANRMYPSASSEATPAAQTRATTTPTPPPAAQTRNPASVSPTGVSGPGESPKNRPLSKDPSDDLRRVLGRLNI